MMRMMTIINEIKKNTGVILNESVEEDVISFLKKHPNPKDSEVHKFAEDKGINTHKLEAVFYSLATKYVQGL